MTEASWVGHGSELTEDEVQIVRGGNTMFLNSLLLEGYKL